MIGDDFQETNQCPKNEKIYPTLEDNEVITLFVQRRWCLKKLFGSALDSEVEGIYCGNYSLGLEE